MSPLTMSWVPKLLSRDFRQSHSTLASYGSIPENLEESGEYMIELAGTLEFYGSRRAAVYQKGRPNSFLLPHHH